MSRSGFFRSFWVRTILGVLVVVAVQAVLVWLLSQRVSWLQGKRYGDILLLFGVVEVLMGSTTMSGSDRGFSDPRHGVPAFPVQNSEQEQRELMLAEFIQRRSFSLRVIAIGVLTILVSIAFTYLF